MTPKPEIIEETSTEEEHEREGKVSCSSATLHEQQQPVKQKRSALWRRNADGTYNNKPSDPEYFKNYYRNNVMCPIQYVYCLKMVQKTKLQRYQTEVIEMPSLPTAEGDRMPEERSRLI